MNNNECLAVRIRVDDVCNSESGESCSRGTSVPHTTTYKLSNTTIRYLLFQNILKQVQNHV